jgi:hypothetical protein
MSSLYISGPRGSLGRVTDRTQHLQRNPARRPLEGAEPTRNWPATESPAAAGVQLAKAQGIIPAPEANHAVRGAIHEAEKCRESGEGEDHYSAEQILRTDKGQNGIEKSFGFLEDDQIVNALFLKRPDRIEAIAAQASSFKGTLPSVPFF